MIGCGQINSLSIDLSLEFSELSVELFDSLFEIGLVLGFLRSEFIEAVDDFSSEFIEGINNLSNDILVGEVL